MERSPCAHPSFETAARKARPPCTHWKTVLSRSTHEADRGPCVGQASRQDRAMCLRPWFVGSIPAGNAGGNELTFGVCRPKFAGRFLMTVSASPQLVPGRECGSCMMCCKVPPIKALKKPPGKWCPHAVFGKGCGIYADRPAVCSAFYCEWMRNPSLGPEWKPDKAKLVVSFPDIWVDPGVPNAWREPSDQAVGGGRPGAPDWPAFDCRPARSRGRSRPCRSRGAAHRVARAGAGRDK